MKFIKFANGLYNINRIICFEIQSCDDERTFLQIIFNDTPELIHVITEEFKTLEDAKNRLAQLEVCLNN